jgi:hypothetical protein
MIKTSHSQTIDIYNNEVWNTQQNIILPVIIHSNATLTIEADANFDNNAYIEVHPGGRLVVQNCTLSSFMTPLWPGIILCGDKSAPQNLTNQGSVYLNEAMICNALCAIKSGGTLSVYDFINHGKWLFSVWGGGIIEAWSTQFINNECAVYMDNYIYHNEDNNEVNNTSIFNNCDFIIDPNANFVNDNTIKQVYLCGVRGINFQGCHFTNLRPQNKGTAIYSNDAGILINQGAFPYYVQQCIINGFDIGIYIHNAGTKPVIILNTYTYNNFWGVIAYLINNLRIESSMITGGETSMSGISINGGTNFKIENNFFDDLHFAIVFDQYNPDPKNNHIRYNSYEDCCRANFVIGHWSNGPNSYEYATGLRFLCNAFSNNYSDISIFQNSSICFHLGNPNDAAGNGFFPQSDYNIYNESTDPLTYYYDENIAYRTPLSTYNVIHKNDVTECSCIGVGILESSYYSSLPWFFDLNIYEDLFIATKATYDVKLDEYRMNYGIPINWEDYNNGDLSYQNQVDDYFELTILKDSIDGICTQAIQLILSENELNKSTFKLWISRTETPTMEFVLAQCYLDDNDFTTMDNILNEMPLKYVDYDPEEISKYKTCLDYLAMWNLDETDTLFIPQSSLDSLSNIAQGNGISALYAQSILKKLGFEFNLKSYLAECEPYPSFSTLPTGIKDIETNITLEIIPNPTSGLIHLKSKNIIQEIKIYNIYGKQLFNKDVYSNNANIDISGYSNGIYIVKCMMQDGQTSVNKIIKN